LLQLTLAANYSDSFWLIVFVRLGELGDLGLKIRSREITGFSAAFYECQESVILHVANLWTEFAA
jgi:hypothetical protein